LSISATDEAPSPHCTASRKQERKKERKKGRKEGHAMWRQIATLVEEEEEEDDHVGDDSSKLQIMIVKKEIPLVYVTLLFCYSPR
jgi:hypothetical protein